MSSDLSVILYLISASSESKQLSNCSSVACCEAGWAIFLQFKEQVAAASSHQSGVGIGQAIERSTTLNVPRFEAQVPVQVMERSTAL